MLLGSVALVASLPASAASAAPAASLPSGTMAVAQTGTLTFATAADAYAQESTPGANYGGSANLRVDGGSDPDVESYLRFNVSGVAGTVTNARLRLYAWSGTANGPALYGTSAGWSETALTWNNRPTRNGTITADKAAIGANSWVEYDVTPLVTGDGEESFGLIPQSSDGTDFYSKEGTNRPQLVVTYADSGGGGSADTTAPSAPTNVRSVSRTETSITFAWDASTDNVGVAGYETYRDGASLGSTTALQATASGLACGKAYSVGVEARDAAGNVSPRTTATLTTANCASPPPSNPGTLTFAPAADAYAQESTPGANYGGSANLRVDGGSDPDVESYLRFNVSGVAGTVTNARLRVYAWSGTANGPALYSSGTGWAENALTWNARPARGTAIIDDKAAIGANTWVEYNVTSLVAGNGDVGFALIPQSSDGADFYSKEGLNPPQLVVTSSDSGTGSGDTVPPSAPTNLRLISATETSITFAWDAATDNVAVTEYEVYRSSTSLGRTPGLQATASPLACGTSYQLGVEARDAAGNVSSRTTGTFSTAACNPLPPPSGTAPFIEAAGDIACGVKSTGASCRQMATSDILVADQPDAVLPLGDVQYECGELSNFQRFYDPSWGRVKSVTRPAVGNHEYSTYPGNASCDPSQTLAGAPGYFDYFGSLAGERAKGYYAYNLGSWRLYALNSNCSKVGGCGLTSPQATWLRNDLAANSAGKCILGYWHHPVYSSGGRQTVAVQPLWQILHEGGGDLVLVGHEHNYERFARLSKGTAGSTTPVGDPNGMRQITVGTGGRNRTSFATVQPYSEVRDSSAFGVLKVTLHPSSYAWQFKPAAGYTFTDSGSTPCRS